MLFALKKLITKLILPPVGLLLVALVGLIILKRWPRTGRVLLGASLLTILLLATPAVAKLLLQSLIVASPFDPAHATGAQAIVILGGGLRRGTPEFGDTPTHYTLDRIRLGAMVAQQTKLPILVSGGAAQGQTTEAENMAKVLREEFHTPVRWLEARSRDTEDNLEFTAQLLAPEGIQTVILVTHDFHMRRSLAHCKIVGLKCIPAPVSLRGRLDDPLWVYQLPDAYSLHTSALALHEMIGYLAIQL